MHKKIAFAAVGIALLLSPILVSAQAVDLASLNSIVSACLSPAEGTDPAVTQQACTNLVNALVALIAQIVANHSSSPTITASPTSGPAPLTVQINLAGLNQGQSKGPYSLGFGDNTPIDYSTNAVGKDQVTHVYSQAGTYTINLTARETWPPVASATITVGSQSGTPGITVTAPNGGEQWEEGVLNSVTWSPYNYNPDVNPSSQVSAYLEQAIYPPCAVGVPCPPQFQTLGKVEESGKASIHWITGELNSSGNSGPITSVPPGQYYIRVVNNVTQAMDRSDTPFTILPKSVDLKINGSDGPVTLTNGQQVQMTWTSKAAYCSAYQVGSTPGATSIDRLAASGNMTVYAVTYDGYSSTISLTCFNQDGSYVNSDTVLVTGLPSPASVQVLSPNGGEQIPLSQNYTIRWHQTGLSQVSIALYKNDQWQTWINKEVISDKSTDDNYSYVWEPEGIDPTPGAVYKIYITGQKADGSGYADDKSDAPFSFTSGTLTPGPTITASPISGGAPLNVTFKVSGPLNSSASYGIDFGDSSITQLEPECYQSGCGVTHTYQIGGTYTVTLYQSGTGKDSVIGTATVTVTSSSVTIADAPLPTQGLSDGRLLAFSITTGSTNFPVTQLNLSISGSSATAPVYIRAYTDPGFSVAAPGLLNGVYGSFPSITVPTQFSASGPSSFQIPAGTTNYFLVTTTPGGSVASASSITTSLTGLGSSFSGTSAVQTRTNAPQSQTTVTSITPSSGSNGTHAVITGTNFSSGNYVNLVQLNSAYAVGTLVPSTGGGTTISLPLAFPTSLASGVYTVQVCNGGSSNNACSNSTVTFTVTGPTICSQVMIDCVPGYHPVNGPVDSNGCYTNKSCVANDLSLYAFPTSGTAPLTTTLTLSGGLSGDTITFGDGTAFSGPLSIDTESGNFFTQHTYSSAGTYTAGVTARGKSASAVVAVNASAPVDTTCTFTPGGQNGKPSTISISGGASACSAWCSSQNLEMGGLGSAGTGYGCTYAGASVSSASDNNAQLANVLTALEAALNALIAQLGH